MQDQWGKQRAAYLGTPPKQFTWKDSQGHDLSIHFLREGPIDSEGTPERFGILAEDSTAHARSTWSILNSKRGRYEPQRRIYEPFMPLGASLRLLDVGAWQVWELAIEPVTNGAPPDGLVWLIQQKGSSSLALCGASSYGVMGYRVSENELELRSIGEDASLGSIETLSWVIRSENGHLRAHIGPPSWLFVLGGLEHLASAPSRQLSDHQGVRLLARPILRSDTNGGEAGPNMNASIFPMLTYLQDWSLQIPHYTTDDWAELHWAWTGDWNVGPKRAMVAPSSTAVRFTWAQEVHLFDPKARATRYDLHSLSPADAARMATAPGWKIVLAQNPGAAPKAVALIPPDF